MEKLDLSCGIVPVRFEDNVVKVLLCKSKRYGYYLIPKGHIDPGETEIQAAIRELWEESGCRPIRFLTNSGLSSDSNEAIQLSPLSYVFESKQGPVRKTVKLYLAEVSQEGDIQDKKECEFVEWFPANETTAQLLHHQENINHFIEHVLPNIHYFNESIV
ncbi:hypothetical protein SteCoe_21704 [Stentor coeruleus]|uniref:Nudix hydrolase domain-containing protein n=1 Tax=Stentor coeruleus TaxID=5963 RepID=A0A1R2BPF7_9CILI|nr:hypothetical protein SteCoe_21704 [Stentor coeruleus]